MCKPSVWQWQRSKQKHIEREERRESGKTIGIAVFVLGSSKNSGERRGENCYRQCLSGASWVLNQHS